MNRQQQHSDRNILLATIIVLLAGLVIRWVALGVFPAGMHQDEAYSGYEAYSLLKYGVDSWGYHNPVHFTTWGSGMNALYIYLSMIPIRLFGLSAFSIRFTQALFGSLSLVIFYLLCKETGNKKLALLGLFILAINPWHIMMSRWAWDSNLTVSFLLAGMYFFIIGLKKSPFLILSALFYGMSLYGYPTTWVTLPFILLLMIVYSLYCKRLHFSRSLVAAVIVFGMLALPMLLYVLVNYGIIPEIRTGWISIPKLVVWRSNYFSLHTLLDTIVWLCNLFGFQRGSIQSVLPYFGMYYLFSTPFIIWGFIDILTTGIKKLKQREFFLPLVVIFQVIGALFFLLTLSYPAVHRVNVIHLPLIFCNVYGLMLFWKKFKKTVARWVIALYSISFILFAYTYFTTQPPFFSGYQQALHKAIASEAETVYISDLMHPVFLFESRYPVKDYIREVKYANYPAVYLKASRIGRYRLIFDQKKVDDQGVYIFPHYFKNMYKRLLHHGFKIESYEDFYYAEKIQ
ncbi:hypothetical protein FACS189440_13360 [Bacteroidia bacterium]|nr:hypothetical protein FACS189440_13360 [Bacteroidia bacterium]